MHQFADCFDAERYADNEPVEVRGYRGSRRASTYEEHVVREDLFARALLLARAYDLHQLSALDPYGRFELDKNQTRRVADEARFLMTIVEDPLLAPHLDGVRAVASYCWQHAGDARLVVEGP